MCAKYYELSYTFYKKMHLVTAGAFDTALKFTLFSVSSLKDEQLIKKSKPTWKLKHANCILEYFENFC